MNCPSCGAMMVQGPGGGWACGNCGTVGTTTGARPAGTVVLSACADCQAEVVDGPAGGYCCGHCGRVEEPPGRIRARRQRATTRR